MLDIDAQAVRAVAQKGKIKRVKNDDLVVDDPSQKFILRNLGLLGISFINSDLDFQSAHKMVNDNVIYFWTTYLIKQSPSLEKFFYVDATLFTCYEINAIISIKECSASMKNENIWGFLVNTAKIDWQLIIIVNALGNEKMTVIIFLTHWRAYVNLYKITTNTQ